MRTLDQVASFALKRPFVGGIGLASKPAVRNPEIVPERTTWIVELREAASRLAHRLRLRHAQVADLSRASEAVPQWWRDGLGHAPIFGDGLLSLPASEPGQFSRPVVLMSPAELSATAGGEFVPLAWLDAGEALAMAHDRGTRPVTVVSAKDQTQAEPVASSIVEFIDALMPQTVCQLVGPGDRATIELCGELALLMERGGKMTRREFATADEVGEFVAAFLAEALDAQMEVRYCPAQLRPVIAARPSGRSLPPEKRAEAAVRTLIADGSLELADAEDTEALEALIDDAARFIDKNIRRPRLAHAFAEWLAQHPAVEELYADDDVMQAALVVETIPGKAKASLA